MAWAGACSLDATSRQVPIAVLLLLVVEVFRKGRENPPAMRSWWTNPMTLLLVTFLRTLALWDVIFSFVPIAVLLRTVVEWFRKGRENPLVLRGWWATLVTFLSVNFQVEKLGVQLPRSGRVAPKVHRKHRLTRVEVVVTGAGPAPEPQRRSRRPQSSHQK